MRTITPYGSNVVVRLRKEDAVRRYGLVIPDPARAREGTVVAVGPDVIEIEVGDIVVCPEFVDTDVRDGELEFAILDQEDILAVIERDGE